MSDRIDLDAYAAACIETAADGMTALDVDTLRDSAMELVHQEADSACTYVHHCHQIIDDHENDPCAPNESELGGTYRPDQWREAVTAWAYEVAAAVIADRVDYLIHEIEAAADTLREAVAALGNAEAGEATVTRDCPHGWAAHDREDGNGVLYWLSGRVDGLNAIAINAGPIWLSYTWNATQDGR